jgi:hypothetical protein
MPQLSPRSGTASDRAGCGSGRAQSRDHDKAETAALSETAATAGRAAATATGPLMSNGRQDK